MVFINQTQKANGQEGHCFAASNESGTAPSGSEEYDCVAGRGDSRVPRRRLACSTVTPSNRLLRPEVQGEEGGSMVSVSRIKSLSESAADGDLNSRE